MKGFIEVIGIDNTGNLPKLVAIHAIAYITPNLSTSNDEAQSTIYFVVPRNYNGHGYAVSMNVAEDYGTVKALIEAAQQ